MHKYAEALRAASESLRNEEGNVLAEPVQKGAEQLERVPSYLCEKEPRDFIEDLEAFTRRRPEVVFGGPKRPRSQAQRVYQEGRLTARKIGHSTESGYHLSAEQLESSTEEYPLAVGIGFAADKLQTTLGRWIIRG